MTKESLRVKGEEEIVNLLRPRLRGIYKITRIQSQISKGSLKEI